MKILACDNCNDDAAQKLTTFLQFFDNFYGLVCLNVNMTKFIRKPVWLTICLTALVPLAFGQLQNSNAPEIFGIGASSTNAPLKLVSISPDGIREISDVDGQLNFGTDDNVLAIVETWGSTNGNRVLVVDRKTSAIIADKYVQGVRPPQMKVGAGPLAVRSKESTVHIPVFDGHTFDVVEVNWRTGATRRLPVPFAEGAKRWEITDLYSVPMGIAIERGPFLTIFDPATDTTVLTLNNAGSDLRPTGNYYAFPDFGLVQSDRAKVILYHITEKDFTTMIPSPTSVSYPDSIKNLVKFTRPITRTINGEPCLIWGETTETNSQNSMSVIVVFDLKAKKELLRKSLGTDFSSGFLADPLGQNIYFVNARAGEIFSLNVESQKLTFFAKFGTNGFDWITAN
jgi:hypothetical protein